MGSDKKICNQIIFFFSLGLMILAGRSDAHPIPASFVYLREIDSTIVQDIRYATNHNFVGRPIKGYETGECLLTRQAATALSLVQQELLRSKLSLMVYDCYRPQMAVDDFIHWSQQSTDTKMKAEFYPHVDKSQLFQLGYIAKKSGHSRGSTLDLTIIPAAMISPVAYRDQALVTCIAPYRQRFNDGSIDMGTGYDCMDELSHIDSTHLGIIATADRLILRNLMEKYGFSPYSYEWWHFTMKNEPYPDTYFNFPIVSKG